MGIRSFGGIVSPIVNQGLPLLDKTTGGMVMDKAEYSPSVLGGMLTNKLGIGGSTGAYQPGTSTSGAVQTSGVSPDNGFDIGSFLENNPAYKFIQEQGLKGLQRTAAAKGMFGSGNLLQDLTSFSSGLASQSYNTEIDRIMKMAGVEAGSPAAAGQNYSQAAGAGTDYGSQGMLGLGKLFSLFQ